MTYFDVNAISGFPDTQFYFNPLNAELNPICHLLALLGAHHILYISRIRVKSLCESQEELK
jgi:transposase